MLEVAAYSLGSDLQSYEKFSKAVYASAHAFIDWMSHCQIWQDAMLSIAPATLVTVLPLGCLFFRHKNKMDTG